MVFEEMSQKNKKVLAVIGSRANYGSLKSALDAIAMRPDLSLEIVCFSSAVLEKYGSVVKTIREDGFNVVQEVPTHIEGETPETMAKSAGFAAIMLSEVYKLSRPDYVLLVGDRYEVLPAAMAASYMNILVAHTMGGEVTGTIDESVRHAVSKLAHMHFPATLTSTQNLLRMGEDPEFVHLVGCPRIDLALEAQRENLEGIPLLLDSLGVGAELNPQETFIVVSQHPVTTEIESAATQIRETLRAVSASGVPALVLWPNSDAGASSISATIRGWREQNGDNNMYFVKNLPPKTYMRLLDKAALVVGNSSSGIREGAFLGVPFVNVGSRQTHREMASNVISVEPRQASIEEGISVALKMGRLQENHLYGSGTAGKLIAEILANNPLPPLQKTLRASNETNEELPT